VRRVWWVYAAVGAAVLAAYPVLPDLAKEISYDAISGSVVLAVALGVRRNRPASRLPWYLFLAGQAFYTAADIAWNVVDTQYGGVPTPSVIDGLFLAYYPLVAVGLIALLRQRGGGRQSGTVIDALVTASAVGMVTWLLVRPSVLDPALSPAATMVNLAYPLGDLVLLVLALRLAMGTGRRSRSFWLLVGSLVLTTIADLLYLVLSANATFASGSVTDILWLLGYLTFGAAALHPSMAQLGDRIPGRLQRLSRRRVVMLGGAMLVAPVTLAVSALGHRTADLVAFVIGAGVLYLLVLSRIVGVVRQHERTLRREQVVRAAGVALTAADTFPDVHRVAIEAATDLVGPDYRVNPAADAGGTVRFVLGEPDDRAGGLVVTGPRTLDAEVASSLSALASALTLAAARVAWGEQSRRSERRFRSIVYASSDIVFLTDADGTITWCGPSVQRISGYQATELVGRQTAEFVHPDDAGSAAHLVEAMSRPGASAHADCRLRMRDGSYRVFQVTGQNLLDDPDVAGVVLTGLDVTERRELADELRWRAFQDELTGLANRSLFTDRLRHALLRRGGPARDVAVLFIDLDDFKTVNDSLGHQAGDELLVQVARRLPVALRAADTAARLGGDEFAVLLEEADERQAQDVAQRILAELAVPFLVSGREVFVGASVGVTTSQQDIDDPEVLLRNADIAMYQAKAGGKNRHETYRPSMHAAAIERLELQADLQRAMERDEFAVYYQPVVDLRTNRPVSVEALLRWDHPVRGLVSPDVFVPLAEEAGLIEPLGRWVLEQACQQIRRWHDRYPTGLGVAVNVSFRQLAVPGFVADVARALQDSGLDPAHLTLELTESAFMADVDAAEGKLAALRRLGVRIAIDDFGTGYSSLSYLDRFPVDLLKIDQSFVSALPDPEGGSTLVQIMLDLASRLDISVVAEGIESPAQLATLRRLECPFGQGFLLAPPRPARDIEAALAGNWPVQPGSPVATAAAA